MESTRYFAKAIEDVLGPDVLGFGFTQDEVTPTRVTYRRGRVLLSFAHFIEDQPSPWVAIDVGLQGADGSHHLAGLWRALEDGEAAREYTRWRFEDQASLHALLRRLASDVLPVGAEVWDSEPALEALLAAQAEEADTRYLEDRRRGDLLHARRCYDEGRFQDALDAYVLIGNEVLGAGDRRRLYEARQKVRGSAPNCT